ncbi:hypothetical protein HBHAL_3674 [Halobacillus halophilus DSM 2266]|uniref:Uncharacterized protein n=1 Tax=Halobacillus halophilus (strain ATCC 35676 / DSM 2266 / JCM 20832 / KCTC 3685 / LMG 17431 / NBRC 102448 / NCIMB 2269) TaxID=866895 RepID=I0JPE9_HALH3|nr:hypothetical protein HBHAL_3674 [Halobacillus halophilus DSM 2266]
MTGKSTWTYPSERKTDGESFPGSMLVEGRPWSSFFERKVEGAG